MEQIIHVEVSGILQRLFVSALQYVYDIKCHSRIKDLYDFLEKKRLNLR